METEESSDAAGPANLPCATVTDRELTSNSVEGEHLRSFSNTHTQKTGVSEMAKWVKVLEDKLDDLMHSDPGIHMIEGEIDFPHKVL